MKFKKTLAAAVAGVGGLAAAAGFVSPASASTQAVIRVPNISVTSMRDVAICGTVANPGVVGNGYADWDMARDLNHTSLWSWFFAPSSGQTRDCSPVFTPGDESLEPLGTWHAYPDPLTSTGISQNTATFYIRLGSAAGIAVTRSGKYVAVQGYAKHYWDQFNYGLSGGWQVWPNHPVAIERYQGGKWVRIKLMYTGSNGKTPIYQFAYTINAHYRAVSGTTSTIWGATSGIVTK
jgi:hypothetical protein